MTTVSPTGGDIVVIADLGGRRLRVKDVSRGVVRPLDLSPPTRRDAGAAHLRLPAGGLDNAADYVAFEISTNGGARGPR